MAQRIRMVSYEDFDAEAFANALRHSGLSGRELGRRTDVHGNYVSRVISGDMEEIPQEWLNRCVDAMKGEGDFAGHPKSVVKKVMRGELDFALSLVKPVSEADNDAPTERVKKLSPPAIRPLVLRKGVAA